MVNPSGIKKTVAIHNLTRVMCQIPIHIYIGDVYRLRLYHRSLIQYTL